MIITIDGPAGSGKSTAARNLARALGVAYLDTGATYRAVTLKAILELPDLSDGNALAEIARKADIKLLPLPEGLMVFLDGRDVSREIRSEKVSDSVHFVADSPEVRRVLVELQRKIGAELGDFVTEGRDQGTVVFPDADMKFFLDARPEERARRRADELQAGGQKASYEKTLRSIEQRDGKDRSRAVAPLATPAGAIVIDTTDNTIEQTLRQLIRHVEARR